MKIRSIVLGILFCAVIGRAVTAQTTSFLGESQYGDANTAFAAGNDASFLRSNDGGQSWSNLPTGLSGNILGSAFYNSNFGVIAVAGAFGGSAIYRTTNGGSSWTYQASSSATLQAVSWIAANTVVAAGNSGTVLRSVDGGVTWTPQPSGTTSNIYDIDFIDANTGLAVGQYGLILKTVDGGQSWTAQSSGTIYYLRGVDLYDQNNATAVGDQSNIVHTTNGGASWVKQTAPLASLILYGVGFTSPNNGVIAGQAGQLFRTTNGGSSWFSEEHPAGSVTLASVAFRDASVGIVTGSSGTILRTSDAGATWALVAPGSGGSTPPPAPTLIAPANGATGLSTSLLFSWNPSAGANSYRLQVAYDSVYTTLFYDNASLTGTSQSVGGLATGSTYYWRVNASNSGGASPWSESRSFSTAVPVGYSQITVMTSPAGRSFAVDGVTYTATQAFSWIVGSSHTISTTSPQSGSAGTQYLFTSWSDGGAMSHAITTPSSNATYTASFSTQYYLTMAAGTGGTVSPSSGWRYAGTSVAVSATPSTGYAFAGWTGSGTGSYTGTNNPATVTMNAPVSQSASFSTTGLLPGSFSLLSPGDGSSGQPLSGALQWTRSTYATGYDVYFGTTNPPPLVSANQADTTYSFAGLASGKTYYWRVVARNSAGSVSSAVWSFRTVLRNNGKKR